MKPFALVLACLAVMAPLVFAADARAADPAPDAIQPSQEVDPFIGSTGGGNTVPGAAVPFGFVNFSPDTAHGDTNGYDDWSPLVGFGLTHVSGTGGNSKYGNFRITPTTGAINPRNLAFHRVSETASPGAYSTILDSEAGQIGVDLTATRLTGMTLFTFPKGAPANVLIDVTSAVQLGGNGPRATAGHVDVHADGSLSGWASFQGGWNPAPYKLYFHAVFDRTPTASGRWTAQQGQSALIPGAGATDGGDQRTVISTGWAPMKASTPRPRQWSR